MALFDGTSVETTYSLGGIWCGDLLEIKDEMPGDYTLVNCCFVGIWERAMFLYNEFDVDSENFILSEDKGKRYEAYPFDLAELYGKPPVVKVNIKVEKSEKEGHVNFKTVLID